MRIYRSLLPLLLMGCPQDQTPSPEKNKNPYHNVAPAQIKQKVETIQQNEEKKNEQRIEQMK